METTYTCPHCGEECLAYAESAQEIEVWCETCQEDITEEFDVYGDYIGFTTDKAHSQMEDR